MPNNSIKDTLYVHYDKIPNQTNINSPYLATRILFQQTYNSYSTNIDNKRFKIIETCITLIKNLVPASERIYDPNTKIWTINECYYSQASKLLEATGLITAFIKQINLDYFINSKHIYDSDPFKIKNNTKEIPTVEEFFNQPTLPESTNSLSSLIEKISPFLLGTTSLQKLENLSKDELIKLYKKAVRKFHPDLNDGDHSKMSELNSLWQEYQKFI